jgi:phytoene synthase
MQAVVDTIWAFQLDPSDFVAFLRSMAMDLTVTRYETYDDLLDYMAGSAAAVGSMMLPILDVVPGADREAARDAARELGLAFQLTNFLRDVGEDLDRGRIYLPLEDLDAFGVTEADLLVGRPIEPVRRLVAFEVERARAHYARAAPGIDALVPSSRACVRAAYRVYGGILDEVVRAGYDVFRRRAVVPRRRRLALAAGCLLAPHRPLPLPGADRRRRVPGDAVAAG